MIYGNYRIVLDFTVVTSSKKLGLIELNPLHLSRLELMENQYRDGNSYKQISDYLNSNGFRKKLTNGLYSRRDVSMSLLKYRRRLSQNTQSTVLNLVESLVLIPLKIPQNHNLN